MWASILRHYDTHHRPRLAREHDWMTSSTSITQAINRAATASDERGKRCAHQRRIPKHAIRAATTALLHEQAAIAHAATFDALHDVIARTVQHLKGIGALYVYDTALRIAAYRNLHPTRVYLHAGTRAGARALGIAHNTRALEIHELPRALRKRPVRSKTSCASTNTNSKSARRRTT